MSRRDPDRAGIGLRIAAGLVVSFIYFPLLIIVLYAFNTQSSLFTFPPPGLTTRWFEVAFSDPSLWRAIRLSVTVASVATLIALVLGRLLAGAVYRTKFFGREAVFVFEKKADGGFAPRRELLRFPSDSIIMGLEFRNDDLYVLTVNALYLVPQGRVARLLVQIALVLAGTAIIALSAIWITGALTDENPEFASPETSETIPQDTGAY